VAIEGEVVEQSGSSSSLVAAPGLIYAPYQERGQARLPDLERAQASRQSRGREGGLAPALLLAGLSFANLTSSRKALHSSLLLPCATIFSQ